jgi:hypothetical protein
MSLPIAHPVFVWMANRTLGNPVEYTETENVQVESVDIFGDTTEPVVNYRPLSDEDALIDLYTVLRGHILESINRV